ncbi:aminotransferase class V-fold PLP-dependent enzyme [Bacillus pseudomycoides]|uniref:aminotransferase class V-fold PLP-dependent enzyme n=1 Tax=Bacillus pseudomycoides TaxID=64104 RepID=UPI00159BDC57|nr:aminotransferase class V-fold PLP-dependent enzyme [Bacillus pseudomycoides]
MYLNTEQIRSNIPILNSSIYLDTGNVGPLPLRTYRSMLNYLETEFYNGRCLGNTRSRFQESLNVLKFELSNIVKCNPLELTITDSTTYGINIILWGFPFKENDSILTTTFEHFSCLAALKSISEYKNLKVDFYKASLGIFEIEEFFSMVTSKTKLIFISHVSYISGLQIPIKEICERAHELGIFVLVDGAQAVGGIPFDIKELDVDFYAFPAQKWLLGPEGIGALYINSQIDEIVHPTFTGSSSFSNYNDFECYTVANGGRKFEIGTRFKANIIGFIDGIKWLNYEIGWDYIYQKINKQASYAKQRLIEANLFRGLNVFQTSNLIIILLPSNINVKTLVSSLANKYRIFVKGIEELNALRISISFFNNDLDIDTFINILNANMRKLL